MRNLCYFLLVAGACAPAQTAPESIVPAAGARPSNAPRAQDREDNPKELAEWERARRWPYPGDLPSERYLQAKRKIQSMKKVSAAAPFRTAARAAATGKAPLPAETGTWEELGPGNIGGRTRAMLIDPKNARVLYAAGVSGGVWKTTDGGANWKPLTDLLDNITVTTLAMDPSDSDVIYAGTGEYWAGVARGVGVFKTTDGGESWTYLEGTANSRFHYMHKLWVSSADSQRIYAATWAGVMRSLDGGATWSLVVNRTGPNRGCVDLAGRSVDGSDLVIASCMGTSTAPAATVFRSEQAEGSEPWEAVLTVPLMDRASLALAPSNPDIVYLLGAYGSGPHTPEDKNTAFQALYRSNARGAKDTWEIRANADDGNPLNATLLSRPSDFFGDVCNLNGRRTWGNQGDWDNVIAVDPVNPDRVFVGGIDLFRSDDGGRTFGIASYWWAATTANTYLHADQHAILFHPEYNGATNRVMFIGNDGGIARTDNALMPVATGRTAACSSANSQMRFVSLNNNYAVTQFYTGAVFPGGHAYFGGAQDNGTPWGADSAGVRAWGTFVGGDGGYGGVNPRDPNTLYASTQRSTAGGWFRRSDDNSYVFRSAMNGITGPFNNVNFPFFTPVALDPHEPDRLYLGGRLLWRTDNKGVQWRPGTAPFPNGLVSAIAIHPKDPNRVLVGTNQGWIHYSSSALSSNATTEWERARPRFGNVANIAFDPTNPDIAYAVYSTFNSATDQGHVFMTSNGGVTWTAIDGSGDDTTLPDIPAESIAVHPENSSLLYLGTDMGMFISPDGGARWFAEESNLPAAPLNSLHWSDNNGPVLFAFTHGRGVFRQRLTSAEPCKYTLTGPVSLTAFGGAVRSQLTTGAACDWSVFSFPGGFLTTPDSAGRGSKPLNFTAAINESTAVRNARVQVGNTVYAVSQNRPEFPPLSASALNPPQISALPYVAVWDTRNALADPNSPVHSCTQSRDSKGTWIRLSPSSSSPIRVQAKATSYASGLSYGLVVAVYARTPAGDVGPELACVSQRAGVVPAFMNATVTPPPGQGLLIHVSGLGDNNSGGYTVLAVSQQ